MALGPAPDERAALLFQKVRADLERDAADEALAALREAVRLDPAGGAFPAHQYEPVRILGVGGAGTAILCKNLYEDGAEVVVKRLHAEGLERKPAELFREAPVLRRLAAAHPDLVLSLHSYGFADPAGQRGPYLVMDYFPGVSLHKYLDDLGRGLTLPEFLSVAEPVARCLQAAHGLGVLHRDVKPDNVLVRPADTGWQVRLIDFGLAVKCEVARNSQVAPRKTLQGLAAAGTADFASPEQMGKRKEPVGRYSDVYGFGRFCCYALFRTPTPLGRHWRDLPVELRTLVEKCLEEDPKDRPQEFESILAALRRLRLPEAPASVAKPTALVPPPPVLVAKPETPAIQRFQIDLAGEWLQRPTGNGRDREWKWVCSTPAEIKLRPSEEYCLRIGTESTDADLSGVAPLRGLTALRSLSLTSCMQIGSAGLSHLRELTALQELELTWCWRITDTGLAHLRGLTALQSLNLSGCGQVTDAGLAHLRGLTALRELGLGRCWQVTDAGVATLQQALPNCKISRWLRET